MENRNYRQELLNFFEQFKKNHTEEEVQKIVKRVINKEYVVRLPRELRKSDRNILSYELTKIVLDMRNKSDRKEKFNTYLPYIIKNNLKLLIKDNTQKVNNKIDTITEKSKRKIRAASLVLFLGLVPSVVAQQENPYEIEKVEVSREEKEIAVDEKGIILDAELKEQNLKTLTKRVEDSFKKIREEEIQKKLEEERRKKKILESYSKIKSIDELLKRQEELETLDLTDDDKLYKDCTLSAPLQRFIWEQSVVNGYPVDFTFAIIATETRGQFNSSGTASYNPWDGSYDLGLTQQNTKSSVLMFCKKYNVNYDVAANLIQYNDYANIISAFIEYDEIKKQYPYFDSEEYAGCYNGWKNWRKKEISREYVDIFNEYYYDDYTNYHKVLAK